MPPTAAEQRILNYLAARPNEVALLSGEFNGCGKRSAVGRALCRLVAEEVLVRGR